MNELLALFNIQALDEYDVGHLMWVLNSPSYARVFKPYLESIKNSAMRMLLDPSQDRKDKANDDFLRGVVTTCEGLLTLFENLLRETNFEKMAQSQAEQSDEVEYAAAVAAGSVKPLGVNTDEQRRYEHRNDGYAANEDF